MTEYSSSSDVRRGFIAGRTFDSRWKLEPTGDGYYYIVVQHSGKVLDVADGNTEDGAKIIQWSETGSDNQKWKLENVLIF